MESLTQHTAANLLPKSVFDIVRSKTTVMLRSALCGITMASASVAGIAITTASVAEANTHSCIPLTHTALKIMPKYYYKPNGQSYIRVYMDTKLVNVSRDKVYYIGGNGNQYPAVTWFEISAQGEKTAVKKNENITRHLAPGGKYGMRQVSDRPLDVKIPHLNVDMKVKLTAKVQNPGCSGRRSQTYVTKTFDLRPMLERGKAKQIGRTLTNLHPSIAWPTSQHVPRPRGPSPTDARLNRRK